MAKLLNMIPPRSASGLTEAEHDAAVRSLVIFADAHDAKPTTHHCAGHWLKGKRCRSSDFQDDCYPPGTDHVSCWTRNGKPYAFVFHPYDLHWETLSSLVEWGFRHGVRVNVEAETWHYPGRTTRVSIFWPGRKEKWGN